MSVDQVFAEICGFIQDWFGVTPRLTTVRCARHMIVHPKKRWFGRQESITVPPLLAAFYENYEMYLNHINTNYQLLRRSELSLHAGRVLFFVDPGYSGCLYYEHNGDDDPVVWAQRYDMREGKIYLEKDARLSDFMLDVCRLSALFDSWHLIQGRIDEDAMTTFSEGFKKEKANIGIYDHQEQGWLLKDDAIAYWVKLGPDSDHQYHIELNDRTGLGMQKLEAMFGKDFGANWEYSYKDHPDFPGPSSWLG